MLHSWVKVQLDVLPGVVLLLQRGVVVQHGSTQHVVALLVDHLPLLDGLEVLGPLVRPTSKASRGVLHCRVDVLLALVGLQLAELAREVLSSADLLPRRQYHLLDMSGEVTLRLLRDDREA